LPKSDSAALILVQIAPTAPVDETILFTHAPVIAWNCRLQYQRTGSQNCCDVWLDRLSVAELDSGGARRYTHKAQVRRGLDGLPAIMQQSLGHAPCAGSAFIFRNRLRLLLWDGNGVW